MSDELVTLAEDETGRAVAFGYMHKEEEVKKPVLTQEQIEADDLHLRSLLQAYEIYFFNLQDAERQYKHAKKIYKEKLALAEKVFGENMTNAYNTYYEKLGCAPRYIYKNGKMKEV